MACEKGCLTSRFRRLEQASATMPGYLPASDLERWEDDRQEAEGCIPSLWIVR
jgi:hypothetical protein